MSKLLKTILSFDTEDWLYLGMALTAVIISILDFLGWLDLDTNLLVQIALVGIGFLLSAVVVQAKRQKDFLLQLENDLEQFVGTKYEARVFPNAELGIKYAANKVQTAKIFVDHASISPPVPRWYSSLSQFEKAIDQVASANKVKMRYLANFSDEGRIKRVQRVLANREVNRYFVASLSPEVLTYNFMNFVIFDGEELLLIISGFGEQATWILIKNAKIAMVFEQYYDLLWSKATLFDRTTISNLSN